MGNCCSLDGAERTVLLLSLADGSVMHSALSKLSLFDGDTTDFKVAFQAKAGPLCEFGVNRSPDGLKPLTLTEAKATQKMLRRHELFHGGVQCLFAAWCTFGGAKAVVVLTSLGRLFAVAGKVVTTCHATQLSSAKLVSDEEELRLTLTGSGQWDLASSPAAAAQLQQMLWVCHSLAEGHLALVSGCPCEGWPARNLPGSRKPSTNTGTDQVRLRIFQRCPHLECSGPCACI
jgi:hypothetical protein